jgi:hypothetical protein
MIASGDSDQSRMGTRHELEAALYSTRIQLQLPVITCQHKPLVLCPLVPTLRVLVPTGT